MNPTTFEIVATVLFGLAILHTFSVKFFKTLASRYRQGSVLENLFHLLSEIEVVFGFWAGILVIWIACFQGGNEALLFVESKSFAEPIFVGVIMIMAATEPCLFLVRRVIEGLAKFLPLPTEVAFYVTALIMGPLLGSLFTEPAAMTVTALLLRDRFFKKDVPENFRYLTIAILLVNVSIGGVLTSFAAPPVVMVAGTWGWDLSFMFGHFGWKAMIAVTGNALLGTIFLRKSLMKLAPPKPTMDETAPPVWLIFVHLVLLGLTVYFAHHPLVCVGIFLFFLGVTSVTNEYQPQPKLREGLLVGFFLAGLVVLGGPQQWWLRPILPTLQPFSMFAVSTAVTAVFDNAALTYLGAQVPNLSDALKYSLVAGAVTGGGLTVIANAPNPVGFNLLQGTFPGGAINAARLLVAALVPTLIAALAFWLLP